MIGALLTNAFRQGTADTVNFADGLWQRITNVRRYRRGLRREDNSIQRRVADLKAAGMSPILAAGQGAQSMSPVSTPSGKMMDGNSDLGATLLAEHATKREDRLASKSMARTEEEIRLLREKQKTEKANRAGIEAQTGIHEHNLSLSKILNLRTNETNSWITLAKAVAAKMEDLIDFLKSKNSNPDMAAAERAARGWYETIDTQDLTEPQLEAVSEAIDKVNRSPSQQSLDSLRQLFGGGPQE